MSGDRLTAPDERRALSVVLGQAQQTRWRAGRVEAACAARLPWRDRALLRAIEALESCESALGHPWYPLCVALSCSPWWPAGDQDADRDYWQVVWAAVRRSFSR